MVFDESQHPREHGRFALKGSAGGHEAQIAPAQPSSVNAEHDTYRQPSVESMALDAKKFEHNIGLFSNPADYPNFRPSELVGTAHERAEAIVKNMTSNLVFLYQHATADTQHEGTIWYQSAHNVAFAAAAKGGLNPAGVAGAFARLSPQKDWDQNVEMGKRLTDIYATKQDYKFDAAMAKQSPLTWDIKPGKGDKIPTGADLEKKQALFASFRDGIAGKTLGELKGQPVLQAVWIRTYDEAHNSPNYPTFRPDGSEGPIAHNAPNAKFPEGKPTTMVWQNTANVADAVRLLESNGDNRVISELMGDGHKIRSFYNNILDPHSPNQDVTVDTHQVGAALLRALGANTVPVSQNFGNANTKPGMANAANSAVTGLKGTYGLYADATRAAARQVGVKDAEMMQAVTWVVKRNLLGETSDKTNAAIEQTWHDYRAGKISQPEAQEQIWKMATADVTQKRATAAANQTKWREKAAKS